MMIKTIVITILLLSSLGAGEQIGLFANVINVEKDDVLNVRAKPNYRSKKTGSFDPDGYMMVDYCKKVGKSNWCKVSPDPLMDRGGRGWVNAKFLKFKDSGYVNIKNRKNQCFYSLECKVRSGKSQCLVVTKLLGGTETTGLKKEWIDRRLLTPTSNFGAMFSDGDGYCVTGRYIYDYLDRVKLDKFAKKHTEDAYYRAIGILKHLSTMDDEWIVAHIHPTKGVILTENVIFGGEADIRFSRKDIQEISKTRNTKLYWGKTYGKGDDRWMSLYTYLKNLTRPIHKITKIEILKSHKGFKDSPNTKQMGYEIYWIDEDSDVKEYSYLGLVIIVEKYKNEWYVVGMIRDRWTI